MVLAQLAAVAAAAFAPTVLAAAPSLLGVEAFHRAWHGDRFRRPVPRTRICSMALAFEPQRTCASSRSRCRGCSRGRLGWTIRREPTDSAMRNTAPDAADRVWMTAIWGFGAVVARAFTRHAWPADVAAQRPTTSGRAGDRFAHRAVPHRSRSRLGAPAARPGYLRSGRDPLVEAGLMPVSALPTAKRPCFRRRAACRRRPVSSARMRLQRTPTRGFRRSSIRCSVCRASLTT